MRKRRVEGALPGQDEDVAPDGEEEVMEGAAAEEDEDEDEEREEADDDGPRLGELEIWEASSLDLEDEDEDDDPVLSQMFPGRR